MTKLERQIYDKNYKNKNRVKISLLNKIYYIKHKDEIKIQQKEYYTENKEKIIKRDVNYSRIKYYTDIDFKLRVCLRHRLNSALKGNTKKGKTLELLGCSIEFLKGYLAKKFTLGMSWDNYGEWHVDHIKPCVSFDLSKPSEQRKCFNYTNLQPLWAKDNRIKKDKF
jgi:hypothetical protein